MQHIKRFCIVTLCLLILSFGAAAQETPPDSPFTRMLNAVPAQPDIVTKLISYVDFEAVVAAREGAPQVESDADLAALIDSDSPESDIWFAAWRGISTGPQYLSSLFAVLPEARDVMGFELTQIDQALTFGEPPTMATMLQLSYDTDAVTSAHEARGFTAQDAGDYILLCGEDGCDEGNKMNIATRNPANIFGGDLGRSQPTLLTPNLIISSASDAVVLDVAATLDDSEASLMDIPEFVAAAQALQPAEGSVIQAVFFLPDGSYTEPLMQMATSGASKEEIEQQYAELRETFIPMPAPSLVAMGDTVVDAQQRVVIALAYANAEDAQAASEVIIEKMRNSYSYVTQRPFSEMLDNLEVSTMTTSVIETEDAAAVVVEIFAPQPTNEPIDGMVTSSSLLFNLFVRGIYTRDLQWLIAELPPLE